MSDDIKKIRQDTARITAISSGFMQAQVLLCANRVDLFTKLDEAGEATASQIAEMCGWSERGARMLLDALIGLGFVKPFP